MKKARILGININVISQTAAVNRIAEYLRGDKQYYGVTPNPEIVLAANSDEELFHILNDADLSLCDGFGLKVAGWLLGVNLPRVTGADLVPKLLKLAETEDHKVAVINWREGLASNEELAAEVKNRYPSLKLKVVSVARNGSDFGLAEMADFAPQIMLVALGAPHQEKFIRRFQSKLPSVRFAIGIGGALDFLIGKVKRAPKPLRLLGLEWLWRLAKQPWRIKRIYHATAVFMWRFLRWRFVRPYLYRDNVVCLIYKKVQNHYQILIVRRSNWHEEHWQLPQGGTDGEPFAEAGFREATEELGTDKFALRAGYPNMWRYRFKERGKNYPIKRDSGYKGQKQALVFLEFLGDDSDIKINYWDHDAWKWVDSRELLTKVHPVRRASHAKFLDKFNYYINVIASETK